MIAVAHFVRTNQTFHRYLRDYNAFTAADCVAAAFAAGDGNSAREILRKKGLPDNVVAVLRSIDIALRDVEGSEAERQTFRYKFMALRIWNGCSLLFFTLNPHDIKSQLLVKFANAEEEHMERICLDWNDAEMEEYYARNKRSNSLRFHEFAVAYPAAAARCVRKTMKMTIELLFNCAPPANVRPKKQHADGFPCRNEPGIFNYVAGYLGIVEPQMRWTEHMHMLVQLLGFSHPRDFFQGGCFKDTFRHVWAFIASVVFESQEGFAAYLGTDSATASLQQCPVMEVHDKQQKMMGPERSRACVEAQLQGRGLDIASAVPSSAETKFKHWIPAAYGDETLTAAQWETLAVRDSNDGSRSCGNHVCRPIVCHKGRLGKMGFCRMLYWCFEKWKNKKGETVMKRVHGKELHPRWDNTGLPPVHTRPPLKGLPRLERNHAYHFKMTPAVLLGPRCNHDVGVLLKLPVMKAAELEESTQAVDLLQRLLDNMYAKVSGSKALGSTAGSARSPSECEQAWDDAIYDMLESLTDHEFYCGDYATKEQPHAQGVLHTLHDSLQRAEKFAQETPRVDHADYATLADAARRLLQRLVAATNRRIHIGFPTVYARLLGKPNHYASHSFVKYNFGQLFTIMLKVVFERGGRPQTNVVKEIEEPTALQTFLESDGADEAKQSAVRSAMIARRGPTEICFDYQWRPVVFDNFPLYFFIASTDIQTTPIQDGTYLWLEKTDSAIPQMERHHPCYKRSMNDQNMWVRSKVVRDGSGNLEPLPRKSNGDFHYRYDHYRILRTHKAWSVPVLYGRLPSRPTESSIVWCRKKMNNAQTNENTNEQTNEQTNGRAHE